MGSTNRSAAAPTRAAVAAVPLLLLGLAAQPAGAARVEQVRVGDHEDFTRIVVELDGPASYRWETREGPAGPELVLELDATSTARDVASRSELVERVDLRPGPGGATARVALRTADVDVKEMVLPNPHRIVLDLRRAAVRPVARGAAEPPAVTPQASELAPSAAGPEPAAEAPAPEPEPAAPEAPERRTVARAPAVQVPEQAPEQARVDAPPDAGEAQAQAPEAAAPTEAAAPAGTGIEAAQAASEETGAATAPERGGADDPVSRARREAAEAAAAAVRERAARPAPADEPRPAASPGLLDRLASGDPALGLVAAGLGVLLLFLAFLALRRRSTRLAREAAAAPWPPPGAEERPEFAAGRERAAADADAWAADAAEEQEEEEAPAPEPATGSAREPMGPLFSEPPRPAPEADYPAAAGAPVEPEVEAKDGPPLEELERRIERLEARLADGLDARERLERQLAAHTEELRVQRAAIARTQRAVRAAVRGAEETGGSESAGGSGEA